MIASDTRKHPNAIVEASLSYARSTSSNVKYLMTENEQLAKNLQATRKEAKQLQEITHNAVSALGDIRKVIFVEVSSLGETMQKLYDRFVTVHKEVFYLHGLH